MSKKKPAHTPAPPRPKPLQGGVSGKLARENAAAVRQLSLREQEIASRAKLRKRLGFSIRLDEFERVLDLAEEHGESPEVVQRTAFRRGMESLLQWPTAGRSPFADGELFVRKPSHQDPAGRNLPGHIERVFQAPTDDFEAGRDRSAADPQRVRTTPLPQEQIFEEVDVIREAPAPKRGLLPSGATDERAVPRERAPREVPRQAHVPEVAGGEQPPPPSQRAHPSRRPEPLPERTAPPAAPPEQPQTEDTVVIGPPEPAPQGKVSVVSFPSEARPPQEEPAEQAEEHVPVDVSEDAAKRIQDAAAEPEAPAKPKRVRPSRAKPKTPAAPPADEREPDVPDSTLTRGQAAAELQQEIETSSIEDLL